MAHIKPFRAVHYATQSIADLSDVIIPPYDTITQSRASQYRAHSPYNFAHVCLPTGQSTDYSNARELLNQWRAHKILTVDSIPSFYLYRQSFAIGPHNHTRDLLVCAVQLHEFADHVIRPHENTFGKFKKDRYEILKQTEYNLSHVFAMVDDKEGFLHSIYGAQEFATPLLHGSTDGGVGHSVWQIDSSQNKVLEQFFEKKPLYIVDGHHRYESALMYARNNNLLGKNAPASSMLFSIASAYDPALVVLPTHRRVRTIPNDEAMQAIQAQFILSPMPIEQLSSFVSSQQPSCRFALYTGSSAKDALYSCTPRSTPQGVLERLAVYWSDEVLIKQALKITSDTQGELVFYEKDAAAMWNTRTQSETLIFHASPSVSQIISVADKGLFMPQKSTYFFPKLASGLVFRDLNM